MKQNLRHLTGALALMFLPATSGGNIQSDLPAQLGIGAQIGGTTFVRQNSCNEFNGSSTAISCDKSNLASQVTVYSDAKGVSLDARPLPN